MKKGKLIKILASGTALLFVVGVFIVYFIGFKEPAQSVEELIPNQENAEEELGKEVVKVDQSGDIDELLGIVDETEVDKEPAEEQKDESAQTPVKPTEPEKPVGDTKSAQPNKPKVEIPAPIPKQNKDQDAQAAADAFYAERDRRAKEYRDSIHSERNADEATGSFDPIQGR